MTAEVTVSGPDYGQPELTAMSLIINVLATYCNTAEETGRVLGWVTDRARQEWGNQWIL